MKTIQYRIAGWPWTQFLVVASLLPLSIVCVETKAKGAILTWQITHAATGLSSPASKGLPSSVAWAPDGTLGLAYYDYTPKKWQYRTHSSGAWSAESTIAQMAAQGASSWVTWSRWVDLEYTANNEARVVFASSGSTDSTSDDFVEFAALNGSVWDRTTVRSTPGGRLGLHLDANGDANVSHYDFSGVDAGFARATAASAYSSFTNTKVETSGAVGSRGTDVIRDGSGNLYVVYAVNGDLYSERSTNNGATWGSRGLIHSGVRDTDPKLSLDENGRLVVGFVDLFNSLHYATHNGNTWTVEQVPIPVGIDGDNNAHGASMAYFDSVAYLAYVDNNNDLMLASNENGVWQFEEVTGVASLAPLFTSQAYPSIDISSSGKLAISYYDWTREDGGLIGVALADLAPVPEPGSLAIWSLLCLGAMCFCRRMKQPNGLGVPSE